MGTKPHLFLSKVDNSITWQETHSLSRIPREDCHETCSSVERGGEQSQLIPRIGFREDFLVGMSTFARDDSSRGLSLQTGGRDGHLCPSQEVELRGGKADMNERERGIVKGSDFVTHSSSEVAGRSSPLFSACCVHSRISRDFLQKMQTPGCCLQCQQGVCHIHVSAPLWEPCLTAC